MSVQAMKLGAVDFLCKPVQEDELLRAVENALERDSHEATERSEIAHIQELLKTLTPREHEVLTHVISGRLNKQIASALGTVEKTIKVHRARLMRKLEVVSVAELVRLAEKLGIQPAPPST
jgi:FixJ family two-component response regulator